MVALSHATARELGYAPAPDSEDAKRPFVEVSGRKGLGVKADDLLDTLIRKAREEVGKRNPELADEDAQRIARMIGDRRRALLHDQVLARQGHRVRPRRGAQLSRARAVRTSSTRSSGPTTSSRSSGERDGLDEAALVADARTTVPPANLTVTNGSTSSGHWCSRPRGSTKSSSR